MDKPFKIYVQRSYQANNVAVPLAGCKTKDTPCTTSGTIYIVATKKVRYAILLLNGIEGKLELGESYSAFLLCQKSPMMIPEDKDGKPIAAFYVLEQRAQPREVQIHFSNARAPIVSKPLSRYALEELEPGFGSPDKNPG